MIFLTSKDEEIDELMGLNAGADDYIRKPFSQRLLLERVRAVLRRAESRKTPGGTAETRRKRLFAASSHSIHNGTNAPGTTSPFASPSPNSSSSRRSRSARAP